MPTVRNKESQVRHMLPQTAHLVFACLAYYSVLKCGHHSHQITHFQMDTQQRGLVLNGWLLQIGVTIIIVGLTVASNVAGLRQISNVLLYIVSGLHLLAIISFVPQRKWFFVLLAFIAWFASIVLGIFASVACGFPLQNMFR